MIFIFPLLRNEFYIMSLTSFEQYSIGLCQDGQTQREFLRDQFAGVLSECSVKTVNDYKVITLNKKPAVDSSR